MSQKRQHEDRKPGGGGGASTSDDGNRSEEKRQKLPSLRSVIEEAWKVHVFQKFLTSLEPLVRRVVKEEVEVALRKHLPSMKQDCEKQVLPSASQSLQLRFNKKLSLPVFTGSRIEGEEGSPMEVILIDAMTGKIVSSGLESSAKVELVVLEGDFEGDGGNWTAEEFDNNIVKEREGKRPLLNGELYVHLNEGTGVVSEVVFTDNSSWTRSRKFKLGAKVADSNWNGARVREAKTEAFVVKDHRGELYKKHYPPSLADDVWRLEKIGKDGAFHKRLSKENINTVKDFLTLLCLDSTRLRNVLLLPHLKILGTGMSTKMWEVTVDHARTCALDNRKYVYYPPSDQLGVGVVFDIVGQALGLLTEQFVSIAELPETEKENAQKLVKVAFENWAAVIPFDEIGAVRGSVVLPTVSIPSSSIPVESSYASTFPSSQKSVEFGGDGQPSGSSSDIVSSMFSFGSTKALDSFSYQGIDNMDLRYEQPSSFPTQISNSLICDVESLTRSICNEDPFQFFNPETPLQSQNLSMHSQADLATAYNGFLAMSARSAAIGKAQTRWTVLVSVLKWRFSIRRIVALKKNATREMSRYKKRAMFG